MGKRWASACRSLGAGRSVKNLSLYTHPLSKNQITYQLRKAIQSGAPLVVHNETNSRDIRLKLDLSQRERTIVLAGGLINTTKEGQC